MADKFNQVSGVMPPELAVEIIETIARWRAAMAWLVALDEEGRKGLTKPGPEGVQACATMADTAAAYPQVFPQTLADPEEIRRDVALAERLGPVAVALGSLTQAVNDTILAAKSDAYRGGLQLYGMAKLLCTQVPGLTEQIAPLRAVLDRPARRPKAE